jgi:hypothetical protein
METKQSFSVQTSSSGMSDALHLTARQQHEIAQIGDTKSALKYLEKELAADDRIKIAGCLREPR